MGNSETYAPPYGDYCACAVYEKSPSTNSPEAFTVVK